MQSIDPNQNLIISFFLLIELFFKKMRNTLCYNQAFFLKPFWRIFFITDFWTKNLQITRISEDFSHLYKIK